MQLGVIADDFTGASDVANSLAQGGLSTIQLIGVPSGPAPATQAAVIALKSRSIPAADAVAQSLAAAEWLTRAGCARILFKVCSTFDSTPAGNIGQVGEALLRHLKAPHAVVCPVFPRLGRSLFQGHLFVGDRLLNQSGLEHHPLNPMTDPDIRRWLRLQTGLGVGHVPMKVVAAGAPAIADAVRAGAAAGQPFMVVDAVADGDLMVIGAAVRDDALVIGGSGIALGMAAALRQGSAPGAAVLAPERAAAVVLSGSCSPMSNQQIAAYAADHPALRVDPADLLSGAVTAASAVDFLLAHIDQVPALYTTAAPDAVAATQAAHGGAEIAGRIEAFFGAVARGLVAGGVRHIVVGGGETSGAVVSALDVSGLRIGVEIAAGVPALEEFGARGLRFALKSGNFGTVDFYRRAVATLAGSAP